MVQKTPLEIKWKKEYEVFFNNFPQDVECIIGRIRKFKPDAKQRQATAEFGKLLKEKGAEIEKEFGE